MKMTFRGWRREVYPHKHGVSPVSFTPPYYSEGVAGAPLQWNSALQAKGKLEEVGLSGDYLVVFDFEAPELRNWLFQYVVSEPKDALRLLAEMQAEALIALADQEAQEDES